MDIVLINRDDLEDLFKKYVAEAQSNSNDELLTTSGLAHYLGYSEEWVRKNSSKVKRGLKADFPPFFKRGRKLLFKKSVVDQWLEGRS